MTGPRISALGMDLEVAIKRFTTSLPERYKIASGECILNGAVFEVNDETNKVEKVERINYTLYVT